MRALDPVTYELPARRTRDQLAYGADFTAWLARESQALGSTVTLKSLAEVTVRQPGDLTASGVWVDGPWVRFTLTGGTAAAARVQYLCIVITTEPPLTLEKREIEASIVILG